MQAHFNIFNHDDNKLIYDERKKRFVHSKNMSEPMKRMYQQAQFKNQRPDLVGAELEDFKIKLRFGYQLLRQMNYQTKLEMRRLERSMGQMSYLYFYPLLDDFMIGQAIDKPKFGRLWTWDDASKIVNFMTLHFAKSRKYGLDLPVTTGNLLTKGEVKQREEALTDYFLYEMRKPKSSE
uniref:Uncharacterized protein n=1 Tax=Strombidium rassoulzadegani TaxID=1082188 RepID=A0A7S3CSD0_9SPIT|mmetsp:Transcript_6771/g.11374  ORF Transcript_6771/g.11374 Transcript_6771/m.11374 type:complete len:179 (+) Transcript_6771:41-577(+)